MSNVQNALAQIVASRAHTLRILEGIDEGTWFQMPAEGVTHVAWQVGHLSVGEYRLSIARLRETRPEDAAWFPPEFLQKFGQGTTPVSDATAYPPVAKIREVFTAVHEHVLEETSHYSDEQLEEPALIPHPLFSKKIDALWWCARHECTHAGQIALLRRLLGSAPRW